MLVDISNTVDKIFNHQRFLSDKHAGIQLIVGLDELGNKFVHLLNEDIINFGTVEEIDKVDDAIAELKDFALSYQHLESQ